jgi:hypothetical protein
MPGELLPYIGLAARQVRESVGMTQEEMAQRLEMNRSAIGAFERGKRWPRDPDRTVSGYANLAGLPAVDLWARAVALALAAEPIPLDRDESYIPDEL